MTHIKDINALRTSCSYTGAFLDPFSEQKLIPLKKKLVKKAIKQYKNVTACSPFCFQLHEQKLLFWFNHNETTKTLSHTIKASIVSSITF
ncbi:MAG: hypothetical protein PHF86_06810 [Candidatus Nanoarchaeia archaeon]|jgi:hypothetical protein|nr:hypothetical protein [Candidatus Nanoarchaeia archaeon]